LSLPKSGGIFHVSRFYIGNLPKEEVDRQELQAVFAEVGDAVTTKVIKDRKTGKCRGFGFVTSTMTNRLIKSLRSSMVACSKIFLKIEKALPRIKGQEESNSHLQCRW